MFRILPLCKDFRERGEMADASDLGSDEETRGGSSPPVDTIKKNGGVPNSFL